jgi:hypothetical protein
LAPILIVTAEESSLSVERLEQEYALKAKLDADWVARPVALTYYNDHTCSRRRAQRPGAYYGPDEIGELRGAPAPAMIMPQACDAARAARLWDVSENLQRRPSVDGRADATRKERRRSLS